MKEIRPTRFLGVPRVWEKVQEKMCEVGEKNGPLKKAIANWAKSVASEHHMAMRCGTRVKPELHYRLAEKLIFRRIHEALGLDRAAPVGGLYSAAAPISLQTLKYFESIGMPIMEGYGATENMGMTSCNLTGRSTRVYGIIVETLN